MPQAELAFELDSDAQSDSWTQEHGDTAGATRALPESAAGVRPPDGRQLSDGDLLEGLRRGSEAHFNELYARYFQRIYNFTYARMRDHADAEEVVQETFTAVFRSVEGYRGQSSLLSWVYGIAKNTANNFLRKRKAQDAKIERAEVELTRSGGSFQSFTPEEELSLHRATSEMQRMLGRIPTWQADVFAMRHVENLTIADITERTGRSSDAVRSSLYRVKRLLLEAAGQPSPAKATG